MIPLAPPTAENLRLAADRLSLGELVAFPTETVYGLGAHALRPEALARIFEAKRRPFFDPLIVHVPDRSWMPRLCSRVDERAERLMDRFWPGPLTLVLPKTDLVPDLATSGLPTVAVRMPDHPVALGLLRAAGFPLAAPSANPFGRLSPTEASHVQAHFREGIALVLDGGPCAVGVESTILSLEGVTPVLLRAGGLPREDIESVVGPVESARPDPDRPRAPGQLPSHYAPRTPLRLLPGPASRETVRGSTESPETSRIGLLAFRDAPPDHGFAAMEALSPDGDLRRAAANLFACLHRLDALGLDLLLAEPLPEIGLGLAIMDRLRKAAADSSGVPGR
jgi:L-threonylcarbamoyladenylate synthase